MVRLSMLDLDVKKNSWEVESLDQQVLPNPVPPIAGPEVTM
jgi:hypothetical protein